MAAAMASFVTAPLCANALDYQKSLIASPRFQSTIVVRGPIIIGMVYGNNQKPIKNKPVTVYINKRKVGVALTNKHGVWSYKLNSTQLLQNSAHLVEACVELASGNIVWTQAAMFYVQAADQSEGDRSGNVSVANSTINFPFSYINTTTPIIVGSLLSSSFNPVADEVVNVEINGVTIGAATSDSNGVFSFQVGTALTEDSYTVGGHCLQSSVDLTVNDFIVDVTAPAVPTIVDPAQNDTVNTNAVIISGTTEPYATVTVFVDNNTFGDISYSDEFGEWFIEYTLDNGSHSVTAQATDLANNTSAVSAATNFTVSA